MLEYKALVGAFLLGQRRIKNMTLRDVSAKTGLSYSLICRYEKGEILPTDDRLETLGSVLGFSLDQLHSYVENNREKYTFYTYHDDISHDGISHNGPSRKDIDMMKTVALPDSIEDLKLSIECCDLCGEKFPQLERNMLEVHCVNWIMNGGACELGNIVFLCPNCHARVHLYSDDKYKDTLLRKALAHKEIATTAEE